MNLIQKRQLTKDLLAGRKRVEDLIQPQSVIIISEGGEKCMEGEGCPKLDDKPLFWINTHLGERSVSWNQLQKTRGKDQVLIFLPNNNRV